MKPPISPEYSSLRVLQTAEGVRVFGVRPKVGKDVCYAARHVEKALRSAMWHGIALTSSRSPRLETSSLGLSLWVHNDGAETDWKCPVHLRVSNEVSAIPREFLRVVIWE